MLNRSIPPNQWAAVTFLAALVFLTLLLRFLFSNPPVSSHPIPGPIVVEVRGAVRHPGIILLEGPKSTVAEALAAAGGLRDVPALPDSERRREVRTGQRVHIGPTPSGGVEVRLGPMEASARLVLGGKLDINTATEAELCLVPQMKPEFARAILERRGQRPWRSIEELEELPGVGPKTVEKWKNHLEVAPQKPLTAEERRRER